MLLQLFSTCSWTRQSPLVLAKAHFSQGMLWVYLRWHRGFRYHHSCPANAKQSKMFCYTNPRNLLYSLKIFQFLSRILFTWLWLWRCKTCFINMSNSQFFGVQPGAAIPYPNFRSFANDECVVVISFTAFLEILNNVTIIFWRILHHFPTRLAKSIYRPCSRLHA